MASIYLQEWINKSELDYYTMFVKAWIPFNAWYMDNFYDEVIPRTTDRKIIDFIKDNSNRYRDKIISLLRSNDEHSNEFKMLLSNLHFELERHPIPNEDERISFNNTNLNRNNLPSHVVSFRHHDYKVEFRHTQPRTTKRWICQIISKRGTNNTIHYIDLFNWSLKELHENPSYIAIPNDKKQYLDACFAEMNPKKPEIIILNPTTNSQGVYIQPSSSIEIDKNKNLYFINNYELVSRVIIEILYDLRCKLFHGELHPISANLGIYKYAYQIQNILIKELI
ncbi:hypothetical protein K5V07_06085 [Flavobacterium sp. CHNK8]|uniref:hypothetical protein n=1 Tax=Flavobacterium sp. CHNK8 TaxID=2871165 RepID=UPI001C8E3FE4|nr:hypothetical protein [Flavobacterium sp. CHNK8]QZK90081.1 hypothetical protein K5V07_06085 [Flavobacterium sp. CHNK8]